MLRWRGDTLSVQNLCNVRLAFSGQEQIKNLPYHLSGLRLYDPCTAVLRRFDITVNGISVDALAPPGVLPPGIFYFL